MPPCRNYTTLNRGTADRGRCLHRGRVWGGAGSVRSAGRADGTRARVTSLIALGNTSAEIAEQLMISTETVRTHIRKRDGEDRGRGHARNSWQSRSPTVRSWATHDQDPPQALITSGSRDPPFAVLRKPWISSINDHGD
jgi:hypothetical protein